MDISSYESVECEKNIPANIFITSIKSSSYHWHFEYEFILILKGSIKVNMNPKITVLQKNDILLINSKTVHELNKTDEENICLIVQMDFKLFEDWEDKQRHYNFYLNSALDGIYQNSKLPYFINLLSQIGLQFNKFGTNGSKRMKALICTLAADCFDYLPFVINQNTDENTQITISEKLIKIIDYIQENHKKTSVIEDVEQEFGMSNKTLYRFLKNNSGLTIRELVTNCRVESAKNMIKHTDKNLQYIAEVCGFGSDMTFYRSFRKYVGLTPIEYKKNGSSLQLNPSIKGYLNFSRNESFKLLENILKEYKK